MTKDAADFAKAKIMKCAEATGFDPKTRWNYWLWRGNLVPDGEGGYRKSETPHKTTVADSMKYILREIFRRGWAGDADAAWQQCEETMRNLSDYDIDSTNYLPFIRLAYGGTEVDANLFYLELWCNVHSAGKSFKVGTFFATATAQARFEDMSRLAGRILWLSKYIDSPMQGAEEEGEPEV